MKHLRRWILLAACLLLVLAPATASAAVKNGWNAKKAAKRTAYYNKGKKVKGLWQIGGKLYYFNSKGKLQKNKWKKLKGTYTKVKSQKKGTTKKVKVSGTFKFYFDKNGRAIQAGNVGTTQIKLKTIKGKQYGFDEMGHMATGIRATMSGKVYFFAANGVCDKEKSAEMQKVTARERKGESLEVMMTSIEALFGEPKAMGKEDISACYAMEGGEEGDTYWSHSLKYDFLEIQIAQHEKSGRCVLQGVFPVER